MTEIAILGAGSWGTALAIAAARANPDREVILWGRETVIRDRINFKYLPNILLPSNVVFTSQLEQAITSASNLLIAIPSKAFVHLLEHMAVYFRPEQQGLLVATKGLYHGNGEFLDITARRILGDNLRYAVLSGPSFAQEVANGLPTAVVIASALQHIGFANHLTNQFHSNTFRVYTSTDLIGVQLGGVYKNVLAVAAGMSDGLGLGANSRAALLTRGVAELSRLAKAAGADLATIQGLSGVGDIILTCNDNQSRNRRFGYLLAQEFDLQKAHQNIGRAIESVDNVNQLHHLACKLGIDMPIVATVNKVLSCKLSIKQAMFELLSRDPKQENQ